MAECQECPRADLNLTQNGRVKSHAANGKRASIDNPHCPGGSDWPREHVRALAAQGDPVAAAKLAVWGEDPSGGGSVDNRPTAEDVRNAERVLRSPDAPGDVVSAAERLLEDASAYGVQGEVHTHRYEDADDGNGHAGSFCVCGEPEPDAPAAAGSYGTGPNPYRAPLPRGRLDLERAVERETAAVHGALEEKIDAAARRGDVATAGDGSWQGSGPETTRQPSSAEAAAKAPTTGPSSTPGSTASAGSATNGSTKATSSGASETGTTSTPNASKTGSVSSNPATSFVNATPNKAGGAPASVGANDVPRDRWGRYLLPHPQTGQVQPWTRATTVASSIADTFTLSQWSQRMAVKGLTMRPDLYALACGFDVAADRDDMNSVCEQAKSAAGDKVAANLGTAMHNFTAAVDRGDKVNIPPNMLADVNAYSEALRATGLELVLDMIEQRIALTRAAAGEDIAGTFDRVYRVVRDIDIKMADGTPVHLAAGTYVIGDLKTGRDLSYGWGEIAIQETIYAHGINQNGTWNVAKKEWNTLPLGYDDGHDGPMPRMVSEKVGIVVHLPIQKKPGAPACEVYAVDLEQGWNAIQLCVAVRQWRKAKLIATKLSVVDQPVAVAAPVDVSDETIRQADAQLAQNTADREAQAPASGYSKPSAAQMTGHPSVAAGAARQAPPAAHKPTWEERADSVSTKAEASAIYQEMRPHVQKIGQTRFSEIVKRMQKRLSSLVEEGA